MKILLYFEVCNASAISFHGIFLEYFFAKQLCYMITKTMVPDHMFCKENYRKKKQKGIMYNFSRHNNNFWRSCFDNERRWSPPRAWKTRNSYLVWAHCAGWPQSLIFEHGFWNFGYGYKCLGYSVFGFRFRLWKIRLFLQEFVAIE